MDTIARRIRMGKLDHHPKLNMLLLRERNGRQSAFTAYGKEVPPLEREVMHRLMVMMGLMNLSIDLQSQLALTNNPMAKWIRENCLGYGEIFGEMEKINLRELSEWMGNLYPATNYEWRQDHKAWIDVMEACEHFIIMWSYARPGLPTLHKKAPSEAFNSYIETIYKDIPVNPEHKTRFSEVFDLDISEDIAREENMAADPEAEFQDTVKRHMGNWTVDELWVELDKLYKKAEKRGDYRMMREILFMKAKTLGLMQDGVAPVVNVFAVMDTKATDALKSMGLCQTKKLDVVSEQ